MFDKMKQLMEMKKQADRIKRELDSESVDVDNGRGIALTINGSQSFQSVDINETLLTAENKKRLESELLQAINQAVIKSQQLAAKKMQSVMPGGFPGM